MVFSKSKNIIIQNFNIFVILILIIRMGKKEKKEKNAIINLLVTEWNYLGGEKRVFSIYILFFIIANIINLAEPLVIGLIFNSIQETITSNAELKNLIFKITLLLAITIGFWIFHGSGRYLERKTGFIVKRHFLNNKIAKVLELPVAWHKDHHSGNTIDKINKSSSSIQEFAAHMTFRVIESLIGLFGSVIVLLFIDYRTALFALAFSLITLFVIFKFDQKLVKKHKQINELENKASAAIFDYISNIITVITLKLKKTVKREIDHRIMASFEPHKKRSMIGEAKWAFASIAISIMTVAILSWKAYTDFHSGGAIMIGTLYMFYGYLNNIGHTFYNFASLYGSMVKHNARVVNVSPIDEEFEKIKRKVGGRLPKNWKELSFKNVGFTYDVAGKGMHINEVNITLKREEKIAFVGESGSGKSTLLTLIRGLYPPKEGTVYCDKNKLKRGFEDLKNNVTLIPQDPEIFNNTIRYNITMDISTSKDNLNKAIDMAQFRKVVSRLKNGLETNVLEKGVSLSGGEKQRLALARGILAARDSDIILLDEPTSSVDSLNENKIYDSILKEFKDKTIISSIHKLNLLNKFDYIYLFENGKVVAHGTFDEIKKDRKFKQFSSKLKI
ncbi:MAG: ABC transporter ATP-binding protein [Candidatus Woesearchaeota archaeon]